MSGSIFRARGSRVDIPDFPPKPKELKEVTFAERGFWEEDIEEWLESEPRLLGEDLLVIERQASPGEAGNLFPDLVAVDREGALVIVELKQDWSGYDIYWQAAVYAAAYWKRPAEEIIDLYGQYLHGARWRAEKGLECHTGIDFYGEYEGDEREKAVERLLEHTGSETEEDLKRKLNHRQRLVLVAHCFYRSAATAVLWLKEHGLDVTCLRPIPYLKDEPTKVCYVTMTQLIPGPDEEALLVPLREIPSESTSATLDRYSPLLGKFTRSVAAKLKELLSPAVLPDKTNAGPVKVGDSRYFGFWYSHKPWKFNGFSFGIQVRVPEEGGARFRVTALFQFHEATALEADVNIGKLRRWMKRFTTAPFGYRSRELTEGWHEVNESIDVSLDREGAERVAESLAKLIRDVYPRIEKALGRDVPFTPLGAITPSPAFQLLPAGKKPEDLMRTAFAFLDALDPHEWLVNDPNVLGADFLVIQRDHSDVEGLSCDLLAVDRDGALVTVEVWLHDDDWQPHRPTDWRAPLYAAMCWKRTPGEVIDLYTEYLNGDREAAVEKLREHTGSKDERDLEGKLNHRQRALLVGRIFAKEVTTAALWLQEHGVDVACLQLTPYLDEETGERYVDRTDLLQERAPEDLLTGLRTTGRVWAEHVAKLDELERQGQRISKFSRAVARKAKARLEPELWPSETDKSTRKMADFRYFGLWRAESPWYGFYTFVRAPEDDRDTSDLMRVTLLFQFGEKSASDADVGEEPISKLRGLAATFAEKPGWNARSGLIGFYEAGKTVHVALDEAGVELAAETLAGVIREMYPRIERALGSTAPAGAA